jgi:cyclase
MEIVEVSPGVIAFVRPPDEGANAGLIHAADGVVVVDTTSCAPDMQELLDAAGVSAPEARIVINTHVHSDHTWGNQLFDCPILAHRMCREKMESNLSGPWSAEAIKEFIYCNRWEKEKE